ncbi:uncharacterized protein LOC107614698 [Arachis ipaensis]|uniref:uncharacterized protein LOC107614698 n=1 Tax=Arachis ipaensis TaxID=130454 RepID=UPI000A2B1C82|nr:uncharacterized protein LOC107614698 [Arachis ipaensis]
MHKSLSLVSRQFFSLTNRLRTDLAVLDPVRPLLPTLLRRFPNLTTIKITRYFTGDINALLSQIALFDLPSLRSLDLSHQPTFPSHGLQQFSQKFPTLKSLNCSFMPQDLGLIVECFPSLEEIDVNFPPCDEITDYSRVKAFASELKKLRKVNVSVFLLKKKIFYQNNSPKQALRKITHIANAIRQRSQLRSLAFSGSHDKISEFIDALVNLKGFTCLDLSCLRISDEVLCAVAEEGLPLRKLSLQCCKGYGYHGISRLLRKCNHLHYLDLEGTDFLNDQRVELPETPYFIAKQAENSLKKDRPSCFFIQRDVYLNHHDHVELHSLPGEELSSGIPENMLGFIARSRLKILSSSNGLLLCLHPTELFIINPATCYLLHIPLPNHLQQRENLYSVSMTLECDSDNYRLILFDNEEWSSHFDCHVYSHKQGVWSLRKNRFFA